MRFCLAEVPIAMLLHKTDGCQIEAHGKKNHKADAYGVCWQSKTMPGES